VSWLCQKDLDSVVMTMQAKSRLVMDLYCAGYIRALMWCLALLFLHIT
jgi:hypothetical protein